MGVKRGHPSPMNGMAHTWHTQGCRWGGSAAFFRQKWQRLQVSIDFLKFYGILMVYKTIFRFPQQWAAVFVVPFDGPFSRINAA